MYERDRRFAESETLLLEAVQARGLDRTAHDGTQAGALRAQGTAVNVVSQMVHLYDAWSRPARAADWRAKLPPEPQEKAASR